MEEDPQGGNCTPADGSPGGPAIETPGLFRPPYRTDFSWEDSEPNVSSIFFGTLNDPAIDRVEVVRRDQAGPTTQIAAKVITVSGALLERVRDVDKTSRHSAWAVRGSSKSKPRVAFVRVSRKPIRHHHRDVCASDRVNVHWPQS